MVRVQILKEKIVKNGQMLLIKFHSAGRPAGSAAEVFSHSSEFYALASAKAPSSNWISHWHVGSRAEARARMCPIAPGTVGFLPW